MHQDTLTGADVHAPLFNQSAEAASARVGRLELAAVTLCKAQQSACCCRVTPRGGQPVEAETASKAWAGLYAGSSKESARALGCSGAKQFGLAHPRVRKLLHRLPDAARCEAYADWEGEAPSIPPLVSIAYISCLFRTSQQTEPPRLHC